MPEAAPRRFVPSEMGSIHLITGHGFGKTTSALGVALRAVGWGKKAVIVQFMKGRKNVGECRIAKRLRPNYDIYQFGTKKWVNLEKPSKEDKKRAQEGLGFAEAVLMKEKPDLMVLDEINLAAAIGLLDKKDVIEMLTHIPKKTTIYLTGRLAPKEFVDRADFAVEFRILKMPRKLETKKGITY